MQDDRSLQYGKSRTEQDEIQAGTERKTGEGGERDAGEPCGGKNKRAVPEDGPLMKLL